MPVRQVVSKVTGLHCASNESLNHSEPRPNRSELHAQRAEPLHQPHPVFVASRAEQIAEQSAEFSTAVVPCRTWQSPFSQHDSAVQNGAILESTRLQVPKNKKKKGKKKKLTLAFIAKS